MYATPRKIEGATWGAFFHFGVHKRLGRERHFFVGANSFAKQAEGLPIGLGWGCFAALGE
ncbi:hypothetical protein THL1_2824 [Pseudomonas sp. TCU-HL1]|nr:hypothetical protein THL1_2824 [Pseudomonas sp. TCU-HL1]